MFASTPFRALIAALVAVGIHLCCCSAAWFTCAACDARDDGVAVALDLHEADDHGGILDHDHHAATSKPRGDGSPCGGHEGDPHKGECTCSTQDPKTRPAELSKTDLPAPVLVAVLPIWDPVPPGAVGPHELILLDRPLVRPATSLLRLHCALIV